MSDPLIRRGGRQAFGQVPEGFPTPYGKTFKEYAGEVSAYYQEREGVKDEPVRGESSPEATQD